MAPPRIPVFCAACGYTGLAAARNAGKTVACPDCPAVIDVPAAASHATTTPAATRRTSYVGLLILAIGLAGLVRYVVMDTTVASGAGRVHNVGLLHDRQTGLLLSGGAIALGAWLCRR